MVKPRYVEIWVEIFSDTTMDKLPLRKRDGARVIDATKHASRTYSDPGKRVLLKRCVPQQCDVRFRLLGYRFADHKEWSDNLGTIVKGKETA